MQPNLPQMKQNNSLLTRLIVSSLSVFVAGWLLPGVQIDSFTTAVGIAIVLGLLNATLKRHYYWRGGPVDRRAIRAKHMDGHTLQLPDFNN